MAVGVGLVKTRPTLLPGERKAGGSLKRGATWCHPRADGVDRVDSVGNRWRIIVCVRSVLHELLTFWVAPGSRFSQGRIIDAAEAILQDPHVSDRDRAFVAREIVQVASPHADPRDVPVWKRSNGHLTLSIRPGWDRDNNRIRGYPR